MSVCAGGWCVWGSRLCHFLKLEYCQVKNSRCLIELSPGFLRRSPPSLPFTGNEKQLNMLWALKCDNSSDK